MAAAVWWRQCLCLVVYCLLLGWCEAEAAAATRAPEDGARSAVVWRMLVARPHHPRLLEARGCPARYTTSGGREQRGRVLTEAAEAGGPWHGRWQQYLSTVASSSSKYAAAPPGQPLAAQQPDKQHSKVRGNSWSPPSHHHHKRRSTRRFVITEKAPTRAFSWLKATTTAFTFKNP